MHHTGPYACLDLSGLWRLKEDTIVAINYNFLMNGLHSVGPERHEQEEVPWQIITECHCKCLVRDVEIHFEFLDPQNKSCDFDYISACLS
jgi:hypothetical protein